jgi:hypothetical protein
VAPSRTIIDYPAHQSSHFIITNTCDEAIRLSAEAVFFELDSPALEAGTLLEKTSTHIDDLTPYLWISPRVLNLKPGESRHIRLSLKIPPTLAEGDYRAHILLKTLDTKRSQEETEPGVALHLTMNVETAVAVYAHLGTPHLDTTSPPSITHHCYTRNDKLFIEAINHSNYNLEGTVGLWDGAKKITEKITETPWLHYRNSKKTHSFDLAHLPLPLSKNLAIKITSTDGSVFVCAPKD